MGGFICVVMRTMYMCQTISEWDVCKECGRAAGPGVCTSSRRAWEYVLGGGQGG